MGASLLNLLPIGGSVPLTRATPTTSVMSTPTAAPTTITPIILMAWPPISRKQVASALPGPTLKGEMFPVAKSPKQHTDADDKDAACMAGRRTLFHLSRLEIWYAAHDYSLSRYDVYDQ